MKTSKLSPDFEPPHLQIDNNKNKWIIQSTVILMLLVLMIAIILVHNRSSTKQVQTPKAEKLVLVADQLKLQNVTPEGFKNELKGPRPSKFASPTPTPILITPRSVINSNYPRNIQEIIAHLQGEEKKRKDADPFHLYKPENPSDVNLLAINSLRFAPPVWANFRNAAKRKGEESSVLRPRGSELLRSEILLRNSEGGFPRTFVRLNVYSKRHKKQRHPKIIFPPSK